MLRKFKISIDGKEYLVEMEEIGGETLQTVPVVEQPAPTPKVDVPSEQPAAPTTTGQTTPAGNEAMASPMPGTILKILVNVGDEVKENQPLLILEAMKMENEVVAPANGKVSGIHVTLGQTVNAGDALITIK